MRARDLIFHVNCFSCALCGLPLSAGDTAQIRGGRVFCCEHYDTELQLWVFCFTSSVSILIFFVLLDSETTSLPIQQIPYYQPTTQQKGRPRKRKLLPPPDETVLNNPEGTPDHHLSHDGTLRLGRWDLCNKLHFEMRSNCSQKIARWQSRRWKVLRLDFRVPNSYVTSRRFP